MLDASKEVVRADLKVKEFQIQQMELDFYVENCFSIGLQAAIVASFSYNGIIEIETIEAEKVGVTLAAAYYGVTYAVTFVEVLVVFLTTLSATLGPGYALRGPEGSIQVTGRQLKKELRASLILFLFGIFLLFVSLILFVWCQYHHSVAFGVTCVLTVMLAVLHTLGARNYFRFKLPEGTAVSSHFTSSDFEQAQGTATTSAAGAAGGPPTASKRVSFAANTSAEFEPTTQVERANLTLGGASEWGADRVGVLLKLPSSGKHGAWQRRVVVLCERVLVWYASETHHRQGRSKGSLELGVTSCVMRMAGETAIVVSTAEKRLTLKAAAGADLEAWARDIERRIHLCRAQRDGRSAAGRAAVGGLGGPDADLFEQTAVEERDSDRDVFATPRRRRKTIAEAAEGGDFIDRALEVLFQGMTYASGADIEVSVDKF
jgi:hypothetical protein